MNVKLHKGSRRNTDCHIVEVGPHTFYFSYRTCVAYTGPAYPKSIRIQNHWGPTTGRHLSDMYVKDWEVVPDELFEHVLTKASECSSN